MSEISRRQFALYAVAVVLVVLLGGRALRAGGTSADAGASASLGALAVGAGADGTGAGVAGKPGGTTGASGVDVATDGERVLVHVAGAVRHPGVYELDGGARIEDAVRKAGGGRSGADLDALNLAAKVTDGQQVLVVRRAARGAGAPVAGASSAATPATAAGVVAGSRPASVNVNSADVTQLEALDGVGPAIAAKIVDWRTQNGPFRTVDDLAQVAGIGPKKLEAMRAQVVV